MSEAAIQRATAAHREWNRQRQAETVSEQRARMAETAEELSEIEYLRDDPAPARSEHTAMNAATALDRIVLMSKYGGDATDRKADKEAKTFIIRATENYAELLEALEAMDQAYKDYIRGDAHWDDGFEQFVKKAILKAKGKQQ